MISITGKSSGKNIKIGIVLAEFYKNIAKALLSATIDTLVENEVKNNNITVYHVPGALEIPLVAKKLLDKNAVDGIIVLGAVIRGETAHFEYVSQFSTQAASQLALDFGVPVINGILTVENMKQAIERTNGKKENKGRDCALIVLKMLNLLREI